MKSLRIPIFYRVLEIIVKPNLDILPDFLIRSQDYAHDFLSLFPYP